MLEAPATLDATCGHMPGWSLHGELELLVRGDVLTPTQRCRPVPRAD
jgi:hypothetical protein